MADERERQIRERAYALWEHEGRPEGRAEHHWRQASQEIGEALFDQQGATGSHGRPGALDGGLLQAGGLVAGGGPSSAGVGGLGVAGQDEDGNERQQG